MRAIRLAWLVAALVTLAAACAPVNVRFLGHLERIQASVVVQAPFAVQAAPKTPGQVTYYVFELFNVGLATVAATHTTVSSTFTWGTVPNGTYQLRAEAFGMGGVSLTQGGKQTSGNTAIVNSPTVTYSTGASLTVTLPLRGGTGESVGNDLAVLNGNPAAGALAAPLQPATVGGIFTVGGTPTGIAVDTAGDVWVANGSGNYITKLSPSGTVLGTFPCAGQPFGVAADGSGNIWVSKLTLSTVEKFNSAGTSLGTLGVGSSPEGIGIDPNGNAWLAETGGSAVRKISPGLGSLLTSPMPGAVPRTIAFDRWGNPMVANWTAGDVRRLDPATGNTLAVIAVGGNLQGLAVDPLDSIWVSDITGNVVKKFTSSGSPAGTFSVGSSPWSIVTDRAGRLWVANSGSNTVSVLTANGVVLSTIPVGNSPRYLASSTDGSVWVSNNGSGNIMKLVI